MITSVKNNKKLIVGLFLGILLVLPFTIRQYQHIETEQAFISDKTSYNDLYLYYFDEIGDAEDGDMVLINWFNVSLAKHVIIGIYFEEDAHIDRIGIVFHGTHELLKDIKNPTDNIIYDLDVGNVIGRYSCAIFFSGNNTLISLSMHYLT